MIFRTQKLEQLKILEYESSNPEIHTIRQKILKQVWPESSHLHFCETIQSIALKWMNQFVILIEKWLSQASSKYLTKLSESAIAKNVQEKNKINQYLLNLSKYIESMEHPLITSINNIHSLYLKFPSEQLIQQPKKYIETQSIQLESSLIRKKKSLSIQSFTSNIPTKSRSTSKSRKLSFFKNTTSPNLNVFQTFCKNSKNTNQNLNSTVKKVKKDLPFTKTTTSASTFKSGSNDHNQKQNTITTTPSKMNELKQQLQQRLSNSCSSTFFNQIVVEQSISRKSSILVNDKSSKKDKASEIESIEVKKQLQQDLKKSILEELDKKQKQNYEHLLKDIQNKLSNKFDNLLSTILKQQHNSSTGERNQQHLKPNSFKQTYENSIIDTKKEQEKSFKNHEVSQKINDVKEAENYILNTEIQMKKQPSICNMVKQNKQTQKPLYEAEKIEEVKPIEIKRQSKVNTSVIVQNDASKIIKSKNKNSSIQKDAKENLIQTKISPQQISQLPKQSKGYKNSIDQNDSIDSIKIIQTPLNANNHPKVHVLSSSTIEQPKIESNAKKEDNFYMKRIKELNTRMENSFKTFKAACDKLILPVNQTFLLVFSTSYQQFCEVNSFSINSQQMNQTLSKYKSKDQIKSKLPENSQKFLIDSLNKIQKMVNLNCPAEKKAKILEYTEKCIECIESIFFEKPDLKLSKQVDINKKIRQIKTALANSNVK